jgi:5-oxoprolinase (ATP-hydrolysing)
VRDGVFQEAGISELLQAPGKLEGNFGTRNLQDNLSDLKAQVAANQKGANLMHELVRRHDTCIMFVEDCRGLVLN